MDGKSIYCIQRSILYLMYLCHCVHHVLIKHRNLGYDLAINYGSVGHKGKQKSVVWTVPTSFLHKSANVMLTCDLIAIVFLFKSYHVVIWVQLYCFIMVKKWLIRFFFHEIETRIVSIWICVSMKWDFFFCWKLGGNGIFCDYLFLIIGGL